jgi:hypothetical protein
MKNMHDPFHMYIVHRGSLSGLFALRILLPDERKSRGITVQL